MNKLTKEVVSTRKFIEQYGEEISPYDWDTTLKRVREQIDNLIEQYGEDARLDWDEHYRYPYDDHTSPRYTVVIDRFETDEEMAEREAKEDAQRKQQEARELKEYERLQAKFKK